MEGLICARLKYINGAMEGLEMEYREGEGLGVVFRADRFYYVNNQWFFSAREGIEKGPYQSREEASSELLVYINYLSEKGLLN